MVSPLDDFGIEPLRIHSIDERVMQAVRIIQSTPLGDILDLEKLAEATHTSRVHLTRLFRQDLNTTPKAYFDNWDVDALLHPATAL